VSETEHTNGQPKKKHKKKAFLNFKYYTIYDVFTGKVKFSVLMVTSLLLMPHSLVGGY
jgi:hypothetical protein